MSSGHKKVVTLALVNQKNPRSPSKRTAAALAVAGDTRQSSFMINKSSKQNLSSEKIMEESPGSHNKKLSENCAKRRRREVKERNFKCNFCAKRLQTQQKLDLHKATHPPDLSKPHLCPKCNQQCATPTALAAHLQSHKGSEYTCIYCDAKFKYVRDFKQHVGSHQSADGNFQCGHCKKNYKAYHLVRKHVRIFHTTREFDCDRCTMIFQDINNLQRHKLTHSPLSVECVECKRAFRRRDHLTAHIRRMHSKAAVKGQEEESKSCEELKLPAAEDTNIEIVKTNYQPIQLEENPTIVQLGDVANLNLDKNEGYNDVINDGSQYLHLSPIKAMATTSSSSNRRKQIPTKLKAVELNSETVTFVALSEMLTPFLISERDLHEEFKKTDNDFCSPRKILTDALKMEPKEKRTQKNTIAVHECQAKSHESDNLENSEPTKILLENNHQRINENTILEYIKPSHNLSDYFWLHDQEDNIENVILDKLNESQNLPDYDKTKNVTTDILETIKTQSLKEQQGTNDLPTGFYVEMNLNNNLGLHLNDGATSKVLTTESSVIGHHEKNGKNGENDILEIFKSNQNLEDPSRLHDRTKNNENAILEYIRPSENLADYFWLYDQEENIENGILDQTQNLLDHRQLQDQSSKAVKEDFLVTVKPIQNSVQQGAIDIPAAFSHTNGNLGLQLNDNATHLNAHNTPAISTAIQATDKPASTGLNSLYPFSCHLCTNAHFKRRGILVNHYAKLHPQLNLDEVALLNVPIVKEQVLFPCPHCRLCVYKSKAKRKVHILKHHPGQDLGILTAGAKEERLVVGSAEAEIHKCEHCPRQYAARNRLVAHYRKVHAASKPPQTTRQLTTVSAGGSRSLEGNHQEQQEPPKTSSFLAADIHLERAIVYPPASVSPENKLLKLSSAALEFSRWDFLNERIGGIGHTTDDLNRLPVLFDESPYRSIEAQFFEKIGKL